MKRFCLVILLLLSQLVYCQRDLGNVQLRMEIGGSTGNGIQVYTPNKEGCIIGAIEIAGLNAVWHTDILINHYFLTRNDDIFKGSGSNQTEISESALKAINEKIDPASFWPSDNKSMILFSFTPLSESKKADSVKFIFKYVYYKLISKKSLYEFSYDVKYHISFCTVAYDNLTDFNPLKEILPDTPIQIKAHYIDMEERQKLNNKEEIKYIDLAYYKNTLKQIEESVKKSKLDVRQAKFSFEYIRTDKKNEQLILNKLFFPLTGANIAIMDNEYMKFPVSIYRGSLTSPLEFYEKDKNELLRQSPKWRFHKFTYDILIIPLEKKGEELLCDVYFPSSTLIPLTYCYKKSISFKLGERVKIAVPEGHWYINDIIGEKNTIITEESFRNYVNEYFVLFVENMGESKIPISSFTNNNTATTKDSNNYYTVRKGETFRDIARKLHLDISDLKKWNNLKPGSRILPGQKLITKKPTSK